jgi:indole-3-glycerol phosphate synthase
MNSQAGGTAILEKIAASTRLRVEKAKTSAPFEQVQKQALSLAENERNSAAAAFPFERAIEKHGLSFICEVKKASPSKGIIAADFPWLEIAQEYENAGAAAISVLTEPEYFLGSDRYLREIAGTVSVPILRKDFIIDPYQIYEAKLLGAQAVLLICALLKSPSTDGVPSAKDIETLASFINIAEGIGLSALVETHNEREVEQAVHAGARIIGINNRDLATFNVDTGLSVQLRSKIPAGILTVAESGIKSPGDIRAIRGCNLDAVLIGESLMRATDKKRFLKELQTAYSGEESEN